MSNTFQVDLRGVVDLLSHHLYASPRVYLRELLQNALDAITSRELAGSAGTQAGGDPGPGQYRPRIRLEPLEATGDNTLRISDNGVGLTESQVHELLATIGGSSKRDELGFARHDFLGQFGIGLLSCFLVADEIHLVTRAEGAPTVHWVGRSDGCYEVQPAREPRDEVGTTVTVIPRRGSEHWLTANTVRQLTRLYASLLPVSIVVVDPGTGNDQEIAASGPPWTEPNPPASLGAFNELAPLPRLGSRRAALAAYAGEVFGFTPLDIIDLEVPAAGLTGVAYVLPTPANPAARAGHRVYLKRMLLAEGAEDLLPNWAFFVRCVVDTSELRPTASREALYDDVLLSETRKALGDQIRSWLIRLARRDPQLLVSFLDIHHLGVKALALHDAEMLQLVEQWWPMETNVGRMSLAEFRSRYGLIRYTTQHDDYRQIAAVAAAQGLPLVNAGFSFDTEIIERLRQLDEKLVIERLEPSDLLTRFHTIDPGVELGLRPFLSSAQRIVDRMGCEVIIRAFDPVGLPALYLVNRASAFTAELRATPDRTDDLWAEVLQAIASTSTDDRPQLVLNHRNPLVRRVVELNEPSLIGLAIEALYGQALLLGRHPIRPADAALLNSSFLGLLNRAVP